jgi:hypothetical protein
MFTQRSKFSQQHQQASLQEILDAKRPNLLGTSKYQVVAEVVNLIEENESLVSLTIALLYAVQNKTIKEIVLWHSLVSHGMFMNEMLIRSSNSSKFSKLWVNFLHLRLLKHPPCPPLQLNLQP